MHEWEPRLCCWLISRSREYWRKRFKNNIHCKSSCWSVGLSQLPEYNSRVNMQSFSDNHVHSQCHMMIFSISSVWWQNNREKRWYVFCIVLFTLCTLNTKSVMGLPTNKTQMAVMNVRKRTKNEMAQNFKLYIRKGFYQNCINCHKWSNIDPGIMRI